MKTDELQPVGIKDATGVGHWWLRDTNSKQKYDLTHEQFSIKVNMDEVEKCQHQDVSN